jgi:hypothetical protein
MTGTRDKPLGLDMDFAEALERFIGTDPKELPENVLLRQKKGAPKRSPGIEKKAGPKPKPNEPD